MGARPFFRSARCPRHSGTRRRLGGARFSAVVVPQAYKLVFNHHRRVRPWVHSCGCVCLAIALCLTWVFIGALVRWAHGPNHGQWRANVRGMAVVGTIGRILRFTGGVRRASVLVCVAFAR